MYIYIVKMLCHGDVTIICRDREGAISHIKTQVMAQNTFILLWYHIYVVVVLSEYGAVEQEPGSYRVHHRNDNESTDRMIRAMKKKDFETPH